MQKRIKKIYDEICQIFESKFFDECEAFLQNTRNSATLLNNLISDLLDLAKFETQTFTFNYEYFDLIDVINNSFQQMKYLADQKSIKLAQSTHNLCRIDKTLKRSNKKNEDSKEESNLSLNSGSIETIKAEAHGEIDQKINFSEYELAGGQITNDLKILKGVYGDQRRYMQVILNFLSNALKFTPKDG